MAKKKPVPPADADTVIAAIRAALDQHGWASTSTAVDGDGVVVAGRPLPQPEPEDEAE